MKVDGREESEEGKFILCYSVGRGGGLLGCVKMATTVVSTEVGTSASRGEMNVMSTEKGIKPVVGSREWFGAQLYSQRNR